MSWQIPKINWTAQDFFDLDPDLLRLSQNLAFLQQKAAGVLGLGPRAALPSPALCDLVSPELLNRAEQNTAELAAATKTEFAPHPAFLPGDAFWNFRDLNRLEGAMGQIKTGLESIQTAQPVLSFALGGDFFGA